MINWKLNKNPNWPHISDHPHWFLIIRGTGSGKKNHYLI